MRQLKTGVPIAMDQMGWVHHKHLHKDHNLDFVKAELQSRDCAECIHSADVDPKKRGEASTFTELKNKLKRLETKRVDDELVELATEGFEKLSDLEFTCKPEACCCFFPVECIHCHQECC